MLIKHVKFSLPFLGLLLALANCAENPHLQFIERADKAATLQFHSGAFIEKVDLNKVMKDYCGALTPKIIDENRTQLTGGQYRFQKKVEFICIAP